MTNQERIRRVLEAHARLGSAANDIAVDADLYAAGMTSHASVNVMLALEDAFDIEFPDELLAKATFCSIERIESALAGLVAVAA